MNAIRTIIADDEKLARTKLRILLQSEAGINVVSECSDYEQTVQAVNCYKPDLLLLDVQMPGPNGFHVLRAIPTDQMPMVVFTTAYDQYALQAFEAHALDYLLKPFDQERLHRTIERVHAEFVKSGDREMARRILDYLAKGQSESPAGKRLIIKTGGRVVFLDVDEIDWIEADANYVKLNAGKSAYVLRQSIGNLSERLNPTHFVRIHRSTIVNVQKIKELQPCNSGEYIVVLRNGKQLSCSRGYRSGLQSLIDKKL
jgi:two-component system, LytTR family, response regulator